MTMRYTFASMTLVLGLGLGLASAATATGCHRHYRGPYRGGYGYDHGHRGRYEFHAHRLSCGHYVECRYDRHRGRHRFSRRGHSRHTSYWHLHPSRGGYEKCYVTRSGHGHDHGRGGYRYR
jgi:hypothetical protein